jgi:hypothetical protein
MNPTNFDVLESTLHCSTEYHLARFKSNVAPLIYSLGLRLSQDSGVFYASGETLAPYLKVSYSGILRALRELVSSGFFEVVSREAFRPTAYRILKHEEWAANHPGTCCTRMQFPWSDDPGDPLGIEMFSASGGRVKFYPAYLTALRKTGLDDQAILARWKEFLETEVSARPRWRSAFHRFLKQLRGDQRSAA